MIVLGIDTSGKSGGITLAEGDERHFRVLGSAPIEGGTFSAQLVPTVARLLQQSKLAPEALDGFAVVSGPGSFTGLRVGLSAIKGLAEVLQKPIATISLLHALATSANRQGKVIAALDAGRSEVYTGIYECNSADATLVHEQLLTGPEFLVQATQDQISARVTSDAAITDMACRAGADIQRVKRPGSEAIARIGVRKLLRGETVSIEDLDANYLRRSDAEIFFKSNR